MLVRRCCLTFGFVELEVLVPSRPQYPKRTATTGQPATSTVSLRITAKGQVTLNRSVLAHLGAKPGERIDVLLMPHRQIMVQTTGKTGNISEVFGLLEDRDGGSYSIEEINDAIAAGWAGER